ncbi:MAG TPA: hypothetical protein VFO19_11520 [Vicinamibacterales bacterium]|nr:hypothetical protein [Vicinamibacterales bacterium]
MRSSFVAVMLLLFTPAAAWAQLPSQPIPLFVADIRGFYSGLGQDPITAADLGVLETDLPGRGFGFVGGVHVFVIRKARFALGVGGELILSHGKKQEDEDEVEDSPQLEPTTVHQRIQGLSGQLSLNFGDHDGWSYVTAGMGPMRFESYLGDDAPPERGPQKMTINMGGGGRWFAKPHLAFMFDVRFYLTRPQEPTVFYPSRGRYRMVVLSAGISIK